MADLPQQAHQTIEEACYLILGFCRDFSLPQTFNSLCQEAKIDPSAAALAEHVSLLRILNDWKKAFNIRYNGNPRLLTEQGTMDEGTPEKPEGLAMGARQHMMAGTTATPSTVPTQPGVGSMPPSGMSSQPQAQPGMHPRMHHLHMQQQHQQQQQHMQQHQHMQFAQQHSHGMHAVQGHSHPDMGMNMALGLGPGEHQNHLQQLSHQQQQQQQTASNLKRVSSQPLAPGTYWSSQGMPGLQQQHSMQAQQQGFPPGAAQPAQPQQLPQQQQTPPQVPPQPQQPALPVQLPPPQQQQQQLPLPSGNQPPRLSQTGSPNFLQAGAGASNSQGHLASSGSRGLGPVGGPGGVHGLGGDQEDDFGAVLKLEEGGGGLQHGQGEDDDEAQGGVWSDAAQGHGLGMGMGLPGMSDGPGMHGMGMGQQRLPGDGGPVPTPPPLTPAPPMGPDSAFTRLAGSLDAISQEEFLQAICDPANQGRSPSDIFHFRKPMRSNTHNRKSTLLQLSDMQHDAMYALAGCYDVNFLISNVGGDVRAAMDQVYNISKDPFTIWFKNRGRKASQAGPPPLTRTLGRRKRAEPCMSDTPSQD